MKTDKLISGEASWSRFRLFFHQEKDITSSILKQYKVRQVEFWWSLLLRVQTVFQIIKFRYYLTYLINAQYAWLFQEYHLKTVWSQISWLLMEPAYLTSYCFSPWVRYNIYYFKSIIWKNSMKSDKLISGEASWSGSRLFFTKSKIRHIIQEDHLKTVWSQISWFLVKPADLGPDCFSPRVRYNQE